MVLSRLGSRILKAACARTGLTWVRDTPVGIKVINSGVSSRNFERHATASIETLPAEALLLSVDYLVDSKTTLGMPIGTSSHFALMRTLLDDPAAGLRDSAYFKQARDGTVDRRLAFEPDELRVRQAFSASCESLRKGNYSPVAIVRVGDRIYVADGRHRAATCLALGVSVRCVDVSAAYGESYYRMIEQRMRSSRRSYSRHLEFFEEYRRFR